MFIIDIFPFASMHLLKKMHFERFKFVVCSSEFFLFLNFGWFDVFFKNHYWVPDLESHFGRFVHSCFQLLTLVPELDLNPVIIILVLHRNVLFVQEKEKVRFTFRQTHFTLCGFFFIYCFVPCRGVLVNALRIRFARFQMTTKN